MLCLNLQHPYAFSRFFLSAHLALFFSIWFVFGVAQPSLSAQAFTSALNGWQASFQTADTTLTFPFNPAIFPIYSDSSVKQQVARFKNNASDSLPAFMRLEQQGSISRGIIVGNTQDASIESGMDLNFKAFLNDSVFVSAALTDQNTPIQPDGSSLQLREFDRVLMQLQAPSSSASLGDVDFQPTPHAFLKLDRRVMGGAFSHKADFGKVSAGLAVLRGEYRVTLLQPQEGFQGPYRLSRADGSPFVVVLAGSEKIYLNGQLLQRGSGNDYIIDYSFGEIQFTQNRMIRASDRIRVEYQYISEQYPELLGFASYEHQFSDKLNVKYQFVGQRSVLNGGIATEFDQQDRDLLQAAGDNPQALFRERVRPVSEDAVQQIRYNRTDTLINEQLLQIYVYDPEGQFEVFFSSRAGGSYARLSSAQINGIVYEFVGEGNGTHSPFAPFSAPKSLNIQSLELAWKPSPQFRMNNSLALSNQDLNTLSSRNDANNLSLAGRSEFIWNPSRNTAISATYQQTDSSFAQFDRIREAEFEREWGGFQDGLFGEQIASLELSQAFSKRSHSKLSYGQLRTNALQASRIASALTIAESVFSTNGTFRYLQVDYGMQNLDWIQWKQQMQFDWSLGKWTVSPAWKVEWDERNGRLDFPGAELIGGQRPYFLETGPELLLRSATQSITAGVLYREEDLSQNNTVRRSSYLYNASYELNKKHFRTQNSFSWFDIPDQPSFRINHQSEYQQQKKDTRLRLAYEANSQLQGRLIEVYTFVGPQFGQYFWDDLNEDGIEQLDEFFPERSPEEGTHILQFLPADELEGITRIQTSFQAQTSVVKILGLSYDGDVSLSGRINILEESTTNRIGALLRLDSDLLANLLSSLQSRTAWEQDLKWRSASNKWFMRLFAQHNGSLNQRNGFSEQRDQQQLGVETEFRPNPKSSWKFAFHSNDRKLDNQQLLNRSYALSSLEFEMAYRNRISRGIVSEYALQHERGEDQQNNFFQWLSIRTEFSGSLKQGRFSLVNGLRWNDLPASLSPLALFDLSGGQGEGLQYFTDIRLDMRISQRIDARISYSLRSRANFSPLQTATFTLSSRL